MMKTESTIRQLEEDQELDNQLLEATGDESTRERLRKRIAERDARIHEIRAKMERRRDVLVNFTVTRAEQEKIRQMAREENLSVSALIRKKVLGK